MRAIVWHGPGQMMLEDAPEPGDPAAGELIVQPEAVGICGSEVEGYLGRMGNRTPPLVMGHEFAGMVIAAGPGVGGLEGARVAINPLSGCGRCSLCASGRANLCRERRLIGVHTPGAFADLVRVPAAGARVLPNGVSARVGALMEPLANGVHAVRLGLEHGMVERALVIGAGTIGLVTLQAALLSDIPRVSVLEPQPARRARAAALGAHATYGTPDEAREGERDGFGPPLVLDAVGAVAARLLGLALLRPGGALVCIGLAADETPLRFHDVVRSQHRVQGSYAYTMEDYDQAHAWLVTGASTLAANLPPVQPLEDGPNEFARLAQGPPPEFKVFLAGAGRET